jgi:hypothetical protein
VGAGQLPVTKFRSAAETLPVIEDFKVQDEVDGLKLKKRQDVVVEQEVAQFVPVDP